MDIFTSMLAYLDPGTGSYILQAIIMGVVGIIFSIKMFWKKVVSFFENLFSRKTNE